MPKNWATIPEAQTLGEIAWKVLRADIVQCRLRPNTRLRLEELRERYGMSISPLREALMRLQSEGLVTLQANRGFRVSPVSPKLLLDLTETRIDIECLMLKRSITNSNADYEANILAAFHRLSRQQKVDPISPDVISIAWSREHRAFHASLVAACDSHLLKSFQDSLFDRAERYVALSVGFIREQRDGLREHKALMEATLARNIDAACKLNANHIRRTTEEVLAATKALTVDCSEDYPPAPLALSRRKTPLRFAKIISRVRNAG
jgi:DNA-binding GntR family transcriptional regulator